MEPITGKDMEAGAWPKGIYAITLFVEDLEAAKEFYRKVFGLPVVFEDENSCVFRFGDTLVNLLKISEAKELIEPARVASREAGARHGVHDQRGGCGRDVRGANRARSATAERADGSTVGRANCQLCRPGRPYLGDRQEPGVGA